MGKRNFLKFFLFIFMVNFLFFQENVSANEIKKSEMILVPAGTFQMGSSEFFNAQPVHEVILTNDFYMGKYEITNQQYADVLNYALAKGYLDNNALSEKSKRRDVRGNSKSPQKYQDIFDEDSQITYKNGIFSFSPGKEDYPVVEVTWYGAAFYCNMLSEKEGLTPLYNLDDWSCQVYGAEGYRLPTEAEWEYAASYDDGRRFPWGNEDPNQKMANVKHKAKKIEIVETVEVGTFSPKGDSKLGISDMVGNVSEWCNDWYNDFYTGGTRQINPVGSKKALYLYLPFFNKYSSVRTLRGGCFLQDINHRKGMGIPFVMDTVIHPDVYNNKFRSYDFLSRQVIGFRIIRTTVSDKAEKVFSDPDN